MVDRANAGKSRPDDSDRRKAGGGVRSRYSTIQMGDTVTTIGKHYPQTGACRCTDGWQHETFKPGDVGTISALKIPFPRMLGDNPALGDYQEVGGAPYFVCVDQVRDGKIFSFPVNYRDLKKVKTVAEEAE